MTLSASLPMYDLPEMARANESFWRVLRELLVRRGLDVGDSPLNEGPRADPDRMDTNVVFTQICGYPLFKYLRGQGHVLATPCYAMAGCDGPYHRAFFLVRAEEHASQLNDLRGRVFGCNSLRSNTGMNLPRLSLARIAKHQPFFSDVVMTGGHVRSIEQLVSGSIDVCSVDCVTWGFLQRFRPELAARARVLAETASSPSLPFVTSVATSLPDRAALQDALDELATDPRHAEIRTSLALRGVAHLDEADYEKVLDYEREAAALGYPELR